VAGGLLAALPAPAQDTQQQELTELEKQLAADQAKAADLQAREAAIRFGVVDAPDGKLKNHREPVAYLGGLAVFGAFLLSIGMTFEFDEDLLALLLASTIVATVGLIDGTFRTNLEATGMGYDKEIEMISLARQLDLLTTPYVFDPDQAKAMVEAGADVLVAHVGLTTAGSIGAGWAMSLDEAIERVMAIKKAAGVTLNDVVLAMCGGALRAYLLEQKALPDRPLITMVPVSLREEGSSNSGGNQVGALLASLATDLDDPAQRLAAVYPFTGLRRQAHLSFPPHTNRCAAPRRARCRARRRTRCWTACGTTTRASPRASRCG
jgi:hypothetical protein